jgi:hypothetical protein
MANIVKQEPLFRLGASGRQIVWTVENQNIVLNEDNVRFICMIYGGTNNITGWYQLATLKTSPNAMGVGMFDIGTVAESYAKPTYQGRRGLDTGNGANWFSTFKGVPYNEDTNHPIHCIDRFCTNSSNMFTINVTFLVEYLDAASGAIEVDYSQTTFAGSAYIFNGVLGNTNPLTSWSGAQGYNMIGYNPQDFRYSDGSGDYLIRGAAGSVEGGRFVTNMPTKQKMRHDEYGTVAFFNCINIVAPISAQANFESLQTNPADTVNQWINGIAMVFYDITGAIVQQNFYSNVSPNGGASERTVDDDQSTQLIYFGHGLANMQGRGETYPATAVSYDVYATNNAIAPDGESEASSVPGCTCVPCHDPPGKWRCDPGDGSGDCIYDDEKECLEANSPPDPDPGEPGKPWAPIGEVYNYEIITADCRGFEPVRLTWLNRMGTWDYFTFTKKSSSTISTKGKTYTQLAGTWNEAFWNPYDHLGGTKTFINQSTETLSLNTDYITPETAAWLEELFTSSDVYILHDFNRSEPAMAFTHANYVHRYLEGVTVKSKKYTKKTRANDGALIDYKFKVEKSKPVNIQRA